MLGWDDCSKFSRYQPRDPWCIMYKTFEVTWRGLEVLCVCVFCFYREIGFPASVSVSRDNAGSGLKPESL